MDDRATWALGLIGVVCWTASALLALRAARRSATGQRRVWGVVALACAIIAADKAFDLQIHVYDLGQWLVQALGPSLMHDGNRPSARLALLAALFLIGCGGLYWLVRSDRMIDSAKRLSLLGLIVVMAYLGARLAPGLRDFLTPAVGQAVEIICWLLVTAGAVWAPSQRGHPTESQRRA